jgi:hypothetical protein
MINQLSGGAGHPTVSLFPAGIVYGGEFHDPIDTQITELQSLLIKITGSTPIDLVYGSGGGVNPNTIIGVLNQGHVVVHWASWPFFGSTTIPDTDGFEILVNGAWEQHPNFLPRNFYAFTEFIDRGPWIFQVDQGSRQKTQISHGIISTYR